MIKAVEKAEKGANDRKDGRLRNWRGSHTLMPQVKSKDDEDNVSEDGLSYWVSSISAFEWTKSSCVNVNYVTCYFLAIRPWIW